MLRLYRLPPAFDERMNRKVRRILAWSIPIFCISAIWILGNPNILEKTTIVDFDAQSYADQVTRDNLDSMFAVIQVFFERSVNLYAVPFFIILLLYVLIFILSFLFSNVIGTILTILFGCCKVHLKKDPTRRDMWFDARVPTNEMSDEFDLFNSLKSKNWYKNDKVNEFH